VPGVCTVREEDRKTTRKKKKSKRKSGRECWSKTRELAGGTSQPIRVKGERAKYESKRKTLVFAKRVVYIHKNREKSKWKARFSRCRKKYRRGPGEASQTGGKWLQPRGIGTRGREIREGSGQHAKEPQKDQQCPARAVGEAKGGGGEYVVGVWAAGNLGCSKHLDEAGVPMKKGGRGDSLAVGMSQRRTSPSARQKKGDGLVWTKNWKTGLRCKVGCAGGKKVDYKKKNQMGKAGSKGGRVGRTAAKGEKETPEKSHLLKKRSSK